MCTLHSSLHPSIRHPASPLYIPLPFLHLHSQSSLFLTPSCISTFQSSPFPPSYISTLQSIHPSSISLSLQTRATHVALSRFCVCVCVFLQPAGQCCAFPAVASFPTSWSGLALAFIPPGPTTEKEWTVAHTSSYRAEELEKPVCLCTCGCMLGPQVMLKFPHRIWGLCV